MTIEISQDRRDRAHTPAPDTEPCAQRRQLVTGIVAFGVAAAVAGLTLAGLDIGVENLHLAVYAAACFVLAGLATALVCLNAMLADRREFYRRGQLDGWMRGWRGQPPEADDPLLK